MSALRMLLPAAGLAAALNAAPAPPRGAAPGGAGGIRWSVPARWSEGPGSALRAASYTVPPAAGQAAGECAVFFFGPGQGGSADANVERWSKQFEGTPRPQRTDAVVAGLRVTRVRLAGIYLAPGGPMMRSTGRRAGSVLLGAIVEAPEGNVFFKLTGPAATVKAAQDEFDRLVASIRRK
jgi:hypothetical protein